MLNGPVILDCKPEVVLKEPGDFARMVVSTETMKAVERYLLEYAKEASKRLHAVGKINTENIRDDIRYMLGAEETAMDIARNLYQALKRKGATQ